MKNKIFYFVTFKETSIDFGVTIGIYPALSIWLVIPFKEIRVGIIWKANYR